MAGRRWRLARRLSLLLPLRVVLAAGGGGAAAASWRRVGESVLPCVAGGASARQRSGVRVAAWCCRAARAACWEGCGHGHGSGGELVGYELTEQRGVCVL